MSQHEVKASNGRHKTKVGGSEQMGAQRPSGSNAEQLGAMPSNTAPHSCKPVEKILRWGVDSLYLSFGGELTEAVEDKLQRLKLKAQSADPREKAQAQWVVDDHAFIIKDKGSSVFAYILEDACFRIALSKRTSTRLPMASVKLSSRFLSTVTPREGAKRAESIISSLGQIVGEPNVSRIDLFVDFVSFVDMESWKRDAWVTRAREIRQFAENSKFTGWSVGLGGPLGMRLYDKNLQLEKVGAQYLRQLWDQAGYVDGQPVWRLEFEFQRDSLKKFGLQGFRSVEDALTGLWAYATGEWLRLCMPNPEDATRSRWPVHPLWAALSSLDFNGVDMPRLERVVTTNKPSEESVLRRVIACLITFMVLRGLTDYLEAFRELEKSSNNQLEADAFYQGIAAPKLIEERIALKSRQYFTPNGVEETIAADGADDPATAYRKASQGG